MKITFELPDNTIGATLSLLLNHDDFNNILVLDEEFGQPYTPFYSENYKKDIKYFPVLESCIRQYNDFLDSFDFLEEVKEEDNGSK